MLNPSGAVPLAQTLFNGLNTELSPTDLPSGLSPACNDVAFLPGSVFTRPPLKRLSTLGTTAQIVYTHSFPKGDGTIVKMDFDALGGIWANGVQIGTTAAGNRFFAANANGRTYIAVSDGNLGTDVPLQYDGVNLDRVSQDGPGAPPVVANLAIAPTTLQGVSTSATATITAYATAGMQSIDNGDGTFTDVWTTIAVTTAAAHGFSVGDSIVLSGTRLNGTYAVRSVADSTHFILSAYSTSYVSGTSGTATRTALTTLSRSMGVVTAYTGTTAHGLQVGMRFNVSGVTPQVVGGGVTSIVIDNEDNPNVATITTAQPHGLVPNDTVLLNNVAYVEVGGDMVSSVVKSSIQTITTTTAHGLQVGALIYLNFSGIDTINRYPFTVETVPSPTTFTFSTTGADATDTRGGHVYLRFPQIDATTGDSYTVSEVPTSTTFQVPINYVDGTWTSGTLTFLWNGTYYVASVPTPYTLTYTNPGPNGQSNVQGTITANGQLAAGTRGVILLFQTHTGFITGPSPKLTWISDGGQYALVTEIAIGPANVIQRIVGFTLEGGARWFYIPVTPLDPTGLFPIGTSTVIEDNTTTSAIFDFSDESLEAGIALDIPGNNVFKQQVLGPCLGFHVYEGRLMAWGMRQRVQTFLNMGFEGGVLAEAPNVPLGWTVSGTGTLGPGDYGLSWYPNAGATISQSCYQDQYGVTRLQPNTAYTLRAWANGTLTATISSVSTSFTSTASFTAAGRTGQANFSLKTPAVIPADLIITYSGCPMDELEIVYTQNPVLNTALVSYEDNFEAFDGITGVMGASDDTNPIRGAVTLDGILSFMTTGPQGAHYRVEDSSSGEPATWTVRRRGEKCGLTSVWGIATFENWFCWASDTGLRIFEGGNVDKISQEVQTLWNSINPLAKQFTCLANDPYIRRLYILTATGAATVTNSTWVLDYRELNSAAALAGSGTLHITQLGKVSTSDLTRKWTTWSVPLNYCGMVAQANGAAVMAFCGGTGVALSDSLHSACYTLLEGDLSGIDDDYGPFWDTSYYTTSFMPEVEGAAQLQLKPYRMLYTFLTANVSGNGAVFVTPLLGGLNVSGKVTRPVNVSLGLARDRSYGLNEAAERLALQIRVQPQGPQPAPPTAPAGFFLSALVLSVSQHPFSEISGWNK